METYTKIMTDKGLRRARPVTIGGIDYPSVKAAAQALGYSCCTLYRRLANGIDPMEPVQDAGRRRRMSWRKANGVSQVPMRRGTFGRKPVPVMVDGRVYGSVTAAAAAIGSSSQDLCRCLGKGFKCRGHEVGRATDLDLCLREIEERNRQPYQFSR